MTLAQTPTHLVLDIAEIEPGDRVLDVGCGDGEATLQAARRVGPRGLALGVDVSAPLVERARQRACEAGLANVGFLRADARTHRFAPLRFDVVVGKRALTQWTCEEGFDNLARALRPAGRIVFVSRDDPGRVSAELTHAGLVHASGTRSEVDGMPAWIVSASAPVGRPAQSFSSPAASGRRCRPTGAVAATAPEPRSGGRARG